MFCRVFVGFMDFELEDLGFQIFFVCSIIFVGAGEMGLSWIKMSVCQWGVRVGMVTQMTDF